MFVGFINTKISNKHKSLPHSNLLLFHQPLPFLEKNVSSPLFERINRTAIPIHFVTWGKPSCDSSKLLVSHICY